MLKASTQQLSMLKASTQQLLIARSVYTAAFDFLKSHFVEAVFYTLSLRVEPDSVGFQLKGTTFSLCSGVQQRCILSAQDPHRKVDKRKTDKCPT